MTQNDGGAAFPTAYQHTSDGVVCVDKPGMSLRDYFAGQALAGMIETHGTGENRHAYAAHDAYLFADAMLAARNSGGADVG